MIIIGAGLSGLLCGAITPKSIIYEAGPERDTGQKAIFRTRTNLGKVLGIDFQKITVHKGIWFEGKDKRPSLQLAHMYSWKTTHHIAGRSILDTSPAKRFIPPDDFVKQLQDRCTIIWNKPIKDLSIFDEPIISTAPLKINLSLCGMPTIPGIESRAIYVSRIPLENCESYCTIYYPHPEMNVYRASITKNILITEGVGPISDKELQEICWSFGIPFKRKLLNYLKNIKQPYGKIFQINNKIREKAILDMTLSKNLYSLGRYATWRPKLMLDDVLNDIYQIRRMISNGKYAVIKHKQSQKN